MRDDLPLDEHAERRCDPVHIPLELELERVARAVPLLEAVLERVRTRAAAAAGVVREGARAVAHGVVDAGVLRVRGGGGGDRGDCPEPEEEEETACEPDSAGTSA